MAALPLILIGIGPPVAQPADPGAVVTFAEWLANSSPAVIFIVLLLALSRGWLVLPRELDSRDQRIADRDKRIGELEKERDEFKIMAFRAVGLGERVASAAEERSRP